MSAEIDMPEGATKEQVNPQPVVWPECSECGTPYVLRRGWLMTGESRWIWQRDCKHKKAAPRIAKAEAS